MQYKQSPLDYFLQQRISDNAKELKCKFNETLQEELSCLEQIRYSINHCKKNIVERAMHLPHTSLRIENQHSKTI